VYVTQLLLCVHKVQMAKEQVEYLMEVCVFMVCKIYICVVHFLCDKDNNWVMLLFTSCALLTLSLDLVGGMGTGKANPSQV
jgi:hypothetical protein